MDTEIMLDLSDLTGDTTPCSLADFAAANNGDDGVEPMDPEDIAAMRALAVGETHNIGIGGGFIVVRRVS